MTDFARISIPKPPLGGKSTVLREDGIFLLEEGPGLCWHVVCGHAGMHGFSVWDTQRQGSELIFVRELFSLNPSYLGVWHLNSGFQFGLAIKSMSSKDAHAHAPAITPCWMLKSDGSRTPETTKQNLTLNLEKGPSKIIITPNDCVLYEVLVPQMGRASVIFRDGTGREVFATPQGVNGSFLLEQVFCQGGFSIEVDTFVAMALSLVWHDINVVVSTKESDKNVRSDEPSRSRRS